jgi:hypothetical protein
MEVMEVMEAEIAGKSFSNNHHQSQILEVINKSHEMLIRKRHHQSALIPRLFPIIKVIDALT